MTSDNLLDRLADYAAGVLDEAAAAELAEQLRTDPQLAAIATALAAAQGRVTGQLQALEQDAPPMPAAVAERLTAALADAAAADSGARTDGSVAVGGGRHGGLSAPAITGRRDGVERPGGSRPGGARSGTSGPGRRARWTRLVAAAGGVAAAVVLVIGGLLALANGGLSSNSKSSSGTAAQAPALDSGRGAVIRHSANDYTATTLPLGDLAVPASGAGGGNYSAQGAERDGPLVRLGEPGALADCLNAVTAVHPGSVVLVEFARYEHQPAVIVVVNDGSATRTVVVGPDCGLPGSGPDEVYVTPAR